MPLFSLSFLQSLNSSERKIDLSYLARIEPGTDGNAIMFIKGDFYVIGRCVSAYICNNKRPKIPIQLLMVSTSRRKDFKQTIELREN